MALVVEAANEKPATVFIAGAGNARLKHHWAPLSPFLTRLDIGNRLHAEVTEGLYRSLGGQVADEVIVPANFGLGPPSLSYRLLKNLIAEKIAKYEGRPIRLRGHSLGGFLAVEYVHEHPDQNIEVDAWAAPFGDVNYLPGIGALFRERTRRIDKIRQEMGADAPKVTLLGSEGDRLIPPRSSLPDLPDVQRILFTTNPEAALASGYYPIQVDDPPGHVGILSHPEALPLHEYMVVRPRLSVVRDSQSV